MKKLLFLFVCFFSAATITAQEDIAVFVYSTTKLNESTNALRSRIVSALYNNAGNRYTVVDRSAEFWEIQKMELGYQERGYVSDKELVAVGKQLGADKVCGVVITYYTKDGYFFECKILDVEKNKLEGHAEYPRVGKDDNYIHDIGISTSQMVATYLAEQLDMGSVGLKEEAERIKAEQERIRGAEAVAAAKEKEKEAKREREQKRKEKRDNFHCAMASPGGALISSAVVPGLGLMTKGYSGWGVTFLAAEAGLVAGIVVTYNDAQKLLTTLRDPNITVDNFTSTNELYNNNKVMNHVFIGAAAAVYVINIVTSAVCNDKKKYDHNCTLNASYIKTDSEYVPSLSLTFRF